MTIQQFIEAAVERGWKDTRYFDPTEADYLRNFMSEDVLRRLVDHHNFPSIVLDPEAWKAVGKVKGWGNRTSRVCICGMCRIPDEQADRIVWEEQMAQHQMHMMVMNLCNGKTLEECIATL